jgi:hypothetical protein
MSRDTRDTLDQLLTQVGRNRRAILKKLLIGAGALALVAPASSVLSAQDDPNGDGKGKGKAKKGKAKKGSEGKGKKGKGKGPAGPDPTQGEKGKGKGRA